MKIRIFSDLHHECPPWHFWEPIPLETDSETILCLVGDLGWPDNFITNHVSNYANRFKYVLIVLGNHDHWRVGIEKALELFQEQASKIKNVHVLQNNSIDIDGYRFVGSTLWTDMKEGDPFITWRSLSYMMDFKKTPGFTPQIWMKENKKSFEFIQHTVRESELPVVVLTHFLPSLQSCDPKFKGDDGNYYFASEYGTWISYQDKILLWGHGHTHSKCDYVIGSTRIYCNPLGYHQEVFDFNDVSLIEL